MEVERFNTVLCCHMTGNRTSAGKLAGPLLLLLLLLLILLLLLFFLHLHLFALSHLSPFSLQRATQWYPCVSVMLKIISGIFIARCFDWALTEQWRYCSGKLPGFFSHHVSVQGNLTVLALISLRSRLIRLPGSHYLKKKNVQAIIRITVRQEKVE